jgi:type IV secretion system protein VirB10
MQGKRDLNSAPDQVETPSSSSGGEGKKKTKKGIQIAIGVVGVCFIIYNMFLSGGDENASSDSKNTTQQEGKVDDKKQAEDEPINLNSQMLSEIAKPEIEVVKKDDIKDVTSQQNLQTPKLDLPPLPSIPDFDVEEKKPNQTEVPNVPPPPGLGNGQSNQIQAPEQPQQKISQTIGDVEKKNTKTPQELLQEKRNESMFVISGTGPVSEKKPQNQEGASDFIIFNDKKFAKVAKKDDKSKVQTNQIRNMQNTVAQGKVIQAILETAIDSQLPGIVRAIVSKDVYAESGNKIIICRGTRLSGSYSSQTKQGMSRVAIAFNQMITPSGNKISISSQATDQFGRAGIEADTDNRYTELFTNSLLLNFINLGTAIALNKIVGSNSTGQTQIVNNNGSVATTNINPVTLAAQSVIQNTSQIVQNLTSGAMSLGPIAKLPHGTKIAVFTTQDIETEECKKDII